MEKFDTRIILAVLGVLILLTVIVTENLKKVIGCTVPANVIAVVAAEGLTLIPGFTCAQLLGTVILWYHVVAAVVVGGLVALIAMTTYDKWQQTRRAWKRLKGRRFSL